MEQLGSQLTDFHEIWYLSIFKKSVEKIKDSLKSDRNGGYYLIYVAHFFLDWEIFQTEVVEKINTHLIFDIFLENCSSVEKYCIPGLAPNENMAQAHCMQDT